MFGLIQPWAGQNQNQLFYWKLSMRLETNSSSAYPGRKEPPCTDEFVFDEACSRKVALSVLFLLFCFHFPSELQLAKILTLYLSREDTENVLSISVNFFLRLVNYWAFILQESIDCKSTCKWIGMILLERKWTQQIDDNAIITQLAQAWVFLVHGRISWNRFLWPSLQILLFLSSSSRQTNKLHLWRTHPPLLWLCTLGCLCFQSSFSLGFCVFFIASIDIYVNFNETNSFCPFWMLSPTFFIIGSVGVCGGFEIFIFSCGSSRGLCFISLWLDSNGFWPSCRPSCRTSCLAWRPHPKWWQLLNF